MPDSPQSNALEVSVTELSTKLKRTVEDTFGHVRVRGEISGFRGPHSSGHCYFSLKDERARLEAVIWRGQAAKLRHMPEEGLEVIASGKLTTYPGSSKYQIVIDDLEPAGAGALMALLEERRKKLMAEGLFAEDRKQLLPFMPKVIGVVTSPTGAVIRDILHRIADRFPVHVLVWPVRVQGETSGAEVANGVYRLNTLPEDGAIPKPDVIIVARGGGSLEDLWGFNDEALVRAVADSDIPVISAVGHETDWTLIDLAADLRAPTPTAAAEHAVPVKAELEATLADLGARLRGAMSRLSDARRNHLRGITRGLQSADMLLAMPRRRFDEAAGRLERELFSRVRRARDRFDTTGGRLSHRTLETRTARARESLTARTSRLRLRPIEDRIKIMRTSLDGQSRQLSNRMTDRISNASQLLERNKRLLNSLSYKGVLARGFAVIRDENEKLVRGVSGMTVGQRLNIIMQDGEIAAIAHDGAAKTPPKQPPKKPVKTTAKTGGDQGQLF
ncbi:MAG: exodeoxyribonuclease VII large subunit [Pseudomonadota bacterium]